jgi:hypothetical protein
MDWMYVGPPRNPREAFKKFKGPPFQWYLACININTKYLFMIPIKPFNNPDLRSTLHCIQEIQKQLGDRPMTNLRGDEDRTFGRLITPEYEASLATHHINRVTIGPFTYTANPFTEYLKQMNIVPYFSKSPYTNKNRVIDRAIRTIRDKFGVTQNLMLNTNLMAKVVQEYNNSPHTAFEHDYSPSQVQATPELEEYFIRENMYELEDVKEKQSNAGLFKYSTGNVLMIHLDDSKTKDRMQKIRRTFNRLAVFVEYSFGNVECRVITHERNSYQIILKPVITIPIQFTKFVSVDIDNIPEKYFQLII